MNRRDADQRLAWLDLSSSKGLSLHRRIYSGIQGAIVSGRLKPGDQLPPTRRLAQNLGISRTTAVSAYDQLVAEGYLETRPGSGTCVNRSLPDAPMSWTPPEKTGRNRSKSASASRRSRLIMSNEEYIARSRQPLRAFLPGCPALRDFPYDLWNRVAHREARSLPPGLHSYNEPGGVQILREQIALHLRSTRGLACDTDQIIVVNGSQQALGLVALLLADSGDKVWVEDPGYVGARLAFELHQLKCISVPIDTEGLDVDRGARKNRNPKLIFVTPSFQVPLGVTMSLARRIQLLDYAASESAWIIEDDYDSDFTYMGRPLTSLQGIDEHQRVIYLGTFSKALMPALRLGYIVVPKSQAKRFRLAKSALDAGCPVHSQVTVAAFLRDGHYLRHIRRMRKLYMGRQRHLLAAVQDGMGDLLRINPSHAGLHTIGWLPEHMDDAAVSERAQTMGIDTMPLSLFSRQRRVKPGLVLGFAPFGESEMRKAAITLGNCIRELL